ncbi:ankyrin repeat protein [Colletotrichum limetticola]|uniref:Ankyrin repeat protein n=1 Tax=Colletotrichum limetticola TaxID=1209924 RepID=A0ABQ9PNV7_9PEZI|nr:ankyrin repeat protein [Colletotrichum limetticola]
MARIPLEIVWQVFGCCEAPTQSSFPRCCRAWNTFFGPLLYQDNVRYHGSSAVFKTIASCQDDDIALRTLQAASKAGADFDSPFSMALPELCHETVFSVTPLYLAASTGRERIATFLLEQGVDVDGAPDFQLRTPLFIALMKKDASLSLSLLRRGANLESSSFGINALHQAAAAGLKEVVSFLVEERGMDINAGDRNGDTPLIHSLLSTAPADIISHLKRHHADVNKPTTIEAWHVSPLSLACEEGLFGVAQSLLGAGADATGGTDRLVPGADLHLGHYVQYPLELALFAQTRREDGRTLVEKRDLLERLLASGADPNVTVCISARSNWTGPLLMKLVRSKQRWATDYLLSTGRVAIDKRDSRGATSLTWSLSTSHGDARMASVLLRYGAQPEASHLRKVIGTLQLLTAVTDYWGLITVLTKEPKLLAVFRALYTHCFHAALRRRDATASSFLRESPRPVVRLVTEMCKRNISLTRTGVFKMIKLRSGGDWHNGPIIPGLFS